VPGRGFHPTGSGGVGGDALGSPQLAACGHDPRAFGAPYADKDRLVDQGAVKPFHVVGRWGPECGARRRVVGDQVELHRQVADEFPQLAGVLRLVVEILDQDIFHENGIAAHQGIGRQGLLQSRQGIAVVDGHQLRAQRIDDLIDKFSYGIYQYIS